MTLSGLVYMLHGGYIEDLAATSIPESTVEE